MEMEEVSNDIDFISKTLEAHSLVIADPVFFYGGFAAVIKVSSPKYNTVFAAKISPVTRGIGSYTTEFSTLMHITHPNVVNIFDYFSDSKYSYIILDWCANGSLNDKLREGGTIEAKNVITSLISAIEYCHSLGICHSDIKPGNILFDKYDRVKIVDFGLAKKCGPSQMSHRFAGSKHFIAPEVLEMRRHDPFKADVYSLGVTIYAILKRRLPGSNETDFDGMSEGMADCIRRMLKTDPGERPTMQEVVSMELFTADGGVNGSKSKTKIAGFDGLKSQHRLSHSGLGIATGSRVLHPVRLARKAARSCPDVILKIGHVVKV